MKNKGICHGLEFSAYLWLGSLPTLFLPLSPVEAVTWTAFGNVNYIQGDKGEPAEVGSPRYGSYGLGELALHLTEDLNDRLNILSEITLHRTPGADSVSIDLERLQATYSFSDNLQLRAGKFHNILGYWNTTYHHGLLLQTTVDRPLFLLAEKNQGFLPIYRTGLWAEGLQETGLGKLTYDVMLGNNPKMSNADIPGSAFLISNTYDTDSANKAISARITFWPQLFPGAGVGVFSNIGRIKGYGSLVPVANDFQQEIFGSDLFYFNRRIELIGEVFRINTRDQLSTPVTPYFRSTAYYVQFALTLDEAGRYKSYVRYEDFVRKDTDPYFVPLGFPAYHRWLGGLRWNLDARSALKIEGRALHQAGFPNTKEIALQWAFAF